MILCFGCREDNYELEEVINTINKNFDKIDNYVADYSVKEDSHIDAIGKVTYIKPDITRFDDFDYKTRKLRMILFFDNNFEWTYFPQWNEAIKEKLVKKANKKYNFIYHSVTGGEEILSIVYNGKIRAGEAEFFELKVTMGVKDTSASTNVYTFLIDLNTGCVRKFLYNDHKTGKKVIHEFENYKINIPINRQEAELNLPSDARISQVN